MLFMGRVFKTKLIRKITEKMGSMVTLRGKQRLIVDFMGDPIEYSTKPGGMTVGADHPCFARHMLGMAPVGEADCKFPRWVEYIAGLHPTRAIDVIVEATDSDYILIAMLHYEKQCQLIDRDGAGLGRVILRRIQTRGKEHAAGEKSKKDEKRPKRQMEHVHIPLLTEVMSSLVRELFSTEVGTPMMNLVAICALGGEFISFFPEKYGYIKLNFHSPPLFRALLVSNHY